MRLFSLKRAAHSSPATDSYKNILYEECLAEQLHGHLLNLGFPAFALCLCRLLQALGYQDVHLAGRREWKGYNKPGGGGYDLEATLIASLLPLSSRRMIVQIKQFDGLHVHQRSVDELRGTCLRVGAAEALLITTSAFSKVVRVGAAASGSAGSPVAPVRLMDGEELIALLIRYRLGVKESKIKEGKTSTVKTLRGRKLADKLGEADKQWEIDEPFFVELALASALLSKEASTEHQKPMTPPNSTPRQSTTLRENTAPAKNFMQWRVTVRISSNPEAQKRKPEAQKHKDEVHQKEVDQKKLNPKGGN